MSNKVKQKLVNVYNELTGATKNIATVKKNLADALRFNGITNVNDDDTFQRYVDLIKRLKSANSMLLEYTIPEASATTAYKRTIILPMYFGVAGNSGASINSIAKSIIDNDTSTVAASYSMRRAARMELNEEDSIENHIIHDIFGNEIVDGTYTGFTSEDVNYYLDESQQEEFNTVMKRLGIRMAPSVSAQVESDGSFEPNTNATYSYIVDWGDGSGEFIYDDAKTFNDNKEAIYHTYASGGVYNVSISGVYKRIYAHDHTVTNAIYEGNYLYDKDGTLLSNNFNFASNQYMTSVVAWGNTLLNNCNHGFTRCVNLSTIPMYDTTNSFADVTDFGYMFFGAGLTSLPFNYSTNKGLFSGCEKATNFVYTFYQCQKLVDPIPPKLFDGCSNVTSMTACFAECTNMEGGIPVGLFSGMVNLKSVNSCFSNNQKMNGELSDDLLIDCVGLTDMSSLFQNCQKLQGTISRNFLGGLSQLNSMRCAFYNCVNITGITADAFYNLKGDNINARGAFYNCGFTELPNGLLDSLTGTGHKFEIMFAQCKQLTKIPSSIIKNLKVSNARGMFGGCPLTETPTIEANTDWNTYDTMRKWYGIFGNTQLPSLSSLSIELGGSGSRKFSQGKVGQIVLKDKTFVEAKNYEYDSNNPPIGIVYADMFIDPTLSVTTLKNGEGNMVLDPTVTANTSTATHKIYACVLNDSQKNWVVGQINAQDITSITDTNNIEVGYNNIVYNADGSYTRTATRYNGEAYSKAITDWQRANPDKDYAAIKYCNEYSLGGETQKCFLPDGADLWDMYSQREWFLSICSAIIAKGTFTTSTCYPMRVSAHYWSSSESSSLNAWYCSTGSASLNAWPSKWSTLWVRPCFSI